MLRTKNKNRRIDFLEIGSGNLGRGRRGGATTVVDVGVVLAGTHEWGGCALDAACPRPLLPVSNRPLTSYAVEWLCGDSLERIAVCTNIAAASLREAMAYDGSTIRGLTYCEDPMPRGPAGCVRDAVGELRCSEIVVVDGTIVPQIKLRSLREAHRSHGGALTVVVVPSDTRDEGRDRSLSPMGIYVLSGEVLEYIPAAGYQDIKESLIPRLYAEGLEIHSFVCETQAPRVTGVDSYLAVNDWAVERRIESPDGTGCFERRGSALIHPAARVDASATIVGPVLIGPESVIESAATVVGPTAIGASAIIESGAVVSRSCVWNECRVAEGAIIDRCVVADGAWVVPGEVRRRCVCIAARAA